ncbi:MAG: 2,3-diketo-5-methylthio-1-phosphopentane phosphatase, partial [Acidobacteria bacterium]
MSDDLWTRPIVFCDFDGTVTQIDVTDEILTRLADPAWRDVEQEWVRGEIGSRECLERQMALVRASARELKALIDAIPVDPGFVDFCRFVEDRALPFYVVSDGFDYVIRRVLRRSGVDRRLRNGQH